MSLCVAAVQKSSTLLLFRQGARRATAEASFICSSARPVELVPQQPFRNIRNLQADCASACPSPAELYNREALKSAKRISNPGCFATNAQLLLAPLLPYMSATPSVFAISGYSGAGTKTGKEPKVSPASLRDGVKPYSLTDHIHERESGYHLSKLLKSEDAAAALAADDFKVAFMPHVAPWFQGIIATVSIPLKQEMRASEIRALFEERYGGEQLVKIQNEVPEIYQIAGKHGVRIGGIQVHSSGKRVVLVVSPPTMTGTSSENHPSSLLSMTTGRYRQPAQGCCHPMRAEPQPRPRLRRV